MKPAKLKFILQSAVMAALPATMAVTAADTTAPTPARANPPAPACRTPIKVTPQKDSIKQRVPGMLNVLRPEECAMLCKDLVGKKVSAAAAAASAAMPHLSKVVDMTNFKAAKCETSIILGVFPQGGNLVCNATYRHSEK